VRSVFDHELSPYLGQTDTALSLPSDCPWHPTRDPYFDQEKHKQAMSHREWVCEYCGKKFRTEFYIDQHMDRRHQDMINV
jgi:hypothetical protein